MISKINLVLTMMVGSQHVWTLQQKPQTACNCMSRVAINSHCEKNIPHGILFFGIQLYVNYIFLYSCISAKGMAKGHLFFPMSG